MSELGLLLAILAALAVVVAVEAYLVVMAVRRVPPSAYATLEQTIADMNAQMSEMRQQQATDHSDMRRLRGEVAKLEETVERLAAYARGLVREFQEVTGQPPKTPPPNPPVAPEPARQPSTTGQLARRIAARFSLDEIDDLALELGLSEVVAGDTLEARASSLVMAALRRDLVSQLVALCRRERPTGGF